MFGWFKRAKKETPAQAHQRLVDAHMAKIAAQRLYGPRSPSPSAGRAASPAPAPDTSSALLYGGYGYMVGSANSYSATNDPAPATAFISGGGGNYGGGGASGSWESGSSCSSSSSSYDSSSSSSSLSDSSSCSSSGSTE